MVGKTSRKTKMSKLYTLEEVKELCIKAYDDGCNNGYYDEQFIFIDGVKILIDAEYWIKQNLNQNQNKDES